MNNIKRWFREKRAYYFNCGNIRRNMLNKMGVSVSILSIIGIAKIIYSPDMRPENMLYILAGIMLTCMFRAKDTIDIPRMAILQLQTSGYPDAANRLQELNFNRRYTFKQLLLFWMGLFFLLCFMFMIFVIPFIKLIKM
jgi:hypothetical protein